jgi:hypothetical protein
MAPQMGLYPEERWQSKVRFVENATKARAHREVEALRYGIGGDAAGENEKVGKRSQDATTWIDTEQIFLLLSGGTWTEQKKHGRGVRVSLLHISVHRFRARWPLASVTT